MQNKISMKNLGGLFTIIMGIKALLLLGHNATIIKDFYLPFVHSFLDMQNPYAQFPIKFDMNNVVQGNIFPYSALSLYIVSLPVFFLGWISDSIIWQGFLFKLPLLFADLYILYVLKSWVSAFNRKKVDIFIWASPIFIYIIYGLGAPDVLAIAFLFGALNFIFKSKIYYTALFLGLALSCQTSIALVMPFFAIYMYYRRISILNIICVFCAILVTFLIIHLPFLSSGDFWTAAFLSKGQGLLFDFSINMGFGNIVILPAILLALIFQAIILKRYNRDIFLMFLGFSFGTVMIFTPPTEYSYIWVLPFFAFFFINENRPSFYIFFGLQVAAIMYFLFKHNAPYIYDTVSPAYWHYVDRAKDIVLTTQQTLLILNCFWIYHRGIKDLKNQKLISAPILIGVGGNSGAGKSTISDAITEAFTKTLTTVLRGDDMHKWQRGDVNWNTFTHLDPKANHLHKEISFLRELKKGRKIFRRHYDHNTGKFTNDVALRSNNIIIFEGLHPFYLPAQRALYDLKIFINPENSLQQHWKICRDMVKRNYTKEQVLESIEKRSKDTDKYITTQEDKADIIVSVRPENPIKDIGNPSENIPLYYELSIDNNFGLDEILENLSQLDSLHIQHDYLQDDMQKVIIKGDPDTKHIHKATQHLQDKLVKLGVNNFVIPQGLTGAVLCILIHSIFERAQSND